MCKSLDTLIFLGTKFVADIYAINSALLSQHEKYFCFQNVTFPATGVNPSLGDDRELLQSAKVKKEIV